jgi:diguanylate cyclase (GGDEF)-like protein
MSVPEILKSLLANHDPLLVVLAVVVCVTGSWIAMNLLYQTRKKHGDLRSRWTFVTAVGAGSVIWCTHFTAMMAFHPGAPVNLDALVTVLSLAVAVAGAAIAVWIGLSRARFAAELGGALAGVAIAGMHYTGMVAYQIDSTVEWNLSFVALSVAFAVALSVAAFHSVVRENRPQSVATGKIFFAVAIISLHFTGMAALTVIPVQGVTHTSQETFTTMGIAIAAVAMLTICTGLATQLIEARVSHETITRFQQMALTDALTGLPNRVSFAEHLESALAKAKVLSGNLAVIIIDLDRFKEINDLRGHRAGDIALQVIGQRLASLKNETTFLARLGGDEFAAAKSYRNEKHLLELIAKLEALLFEPIVIDDFETVTGASIGVAIYPNDGTSRERLMSNADLAMYRAKNDVGQAVCFFEARMDELVHERHALAQDLRHAIERNQLQLYYQVQTSVSTGKVCGYEALLRWNHPHRGMVPPSEFIPIAEENGLILAIGEWVLRTACHDAAKWDTPHKISVNISPVQFAHVDLAQLLIQILMESQLVPSRLEIEITESTIIADKPRTLHMLRQIRSLGVTIAIDDFGVGYSSLDTLRSFPFDKIKLDRSFMEEVEQDVQAKAIVRAVLALGKSLNIPVLAEGVETTDQLQMLKLEGCDEAQGFLMGMPLPLPAALIVQAARLGTDEENDRGKRIVPIMPRTRRSSPST